MAKIFVKFRLIGTIVLLILQGGKWLQNSPFYFALVMLLTL